jgi:hypothetical protein
MRRLIVLAVCIGLVASPASAGSKAASARYACGAKKMTFYFWPQGHNAVPSLNFPAFATPHLEAYTTGGPFDASVDANGAFGYAKACKKVGDLPARWVRGVKRTTTTTTVVVNCTFPAAADLKASKAGAGGLLIVTLGHTTKLVVMAAIKTTGSTITYDNRYCRTRAAPPQATPTRYTFSGLTASFSLNGFPVTYALSGEVCGDPATTPWSIVPTLNGTALPARSVVLAATTAADAASIVSKDASGAELARATLQLTLSTGPPPQLTLSVVPSGNVTNIQVGGSPAAVTATPVASCP